MTTESKYLVFRGEIIELTKNPLTGLWTDKEGNIFALAEEAASVDSETRCGVGLFSLPSNHPLTAACASHDYMYSSPAYQLFHNRSEADRKLKEMMKQVSWWWWLASPFYKLSRWFGAKFWENPVTRVKRLILRVK
jgi:hypothetical protein